MKNQILSKTYLVCLVLFFCSCDKDSFERNNAESHQSQPSLAKASSCTADCLWGGCSADCDGEGASCYCNFGFANCDCSQENLDAFYELDSGQEKNLFDFMDFVRYNLIPIQEGQALSEIIESFLTAIDDEDFDDALLFRDEIIHYLSNLSNQNKVIIDDYLRGKNLDPIFN